jgi:hypothetical protein
MHRDAIKPVLTALGIPAAIIAATAAPAAAANTTAPTLGSDLEAVSLWRPPMPCVAIRAGAFPLGAGFCPATTTGLDWNTVEAKLDDRDAATKDPAPADVPWEDTGQPITVELLPPTDPSTDAVTIGLDVVLDGKLADELSTADDPHLVIWITMATPGTVDTTAHPTDTTGGCLASPGSAGDFLLNARPVPRC